MNSPTTFSQLSADVASLVERAREAVVSVRSGTAAASGTIVAPGRVIMADHGLDADAEHIEVHTASGPRPARLVGRDAASDLAVLAVDGLDRAPLPHASSLPAVGSLIVSVGRAWDDTVASLGVVHAHLGPVLRRGGARIESLLRTTIAPYPGYSGGPLLDAQGQLVAVATAGLQRGAGLGVPVALADRIAEALGTHGRIRRGFIGLTSMPVELGTNQQGPQGERHGLLVTSVVAEGPAAKAGVLVGDVIVGVNGQPTVTADQLLALLSTDSVGQTILVTLVRGPRPESLAVVVDERGRAH